MNDKTITEKESLEIITSMIARTKERYTLGDGNIILMWGYLCIAISALVWILLAITHNPAVNWLWFLIWIIGGIVSPIMVKRAAVRKGAKSYIDNIISRIWSVVGASAIASVMFCLGFLLIKGTNTWAAMLVFALIIVPFAGIAHGVVTKEKSIIWGGALGLLTGIFTICCIAGQIPLYASWYMPIFIVAFFCMMVIPGHIINHKARSNR